MGNLSETRKITKKDLGKVARRAGFATTAVLGVAGLFASAEEFKTSNQYYNTYQGYRGEGAALQTKFDTLNTQWETRYAELDEYTKVDHLAELQLRITSQLPAITQAREAGQIERVVAIISQDLDEIQKGNDMARILTATLNEEIATLDNIRETQAKEDSALFSSRLHRTASSLIGFAGGLLIGVGGIGLVKGKYNFKNS